MGRNPPGRVIIIDLATATRHPQYMGLADHPDHAADERDAQADQRDDLAEERDAQAVRRDTQADQREAQADQREARLDELLRDSGLTPWTVVRPG